MKTENYPRDTKSIVMLVVKLLSLQTAPENCNRCRPPNLSAVLACLVYIACALSAYGQSGTWTNVTSSSWSDTTGWLDGIIAQGPDNTATFSADLTGGATTTVTVDSLDYMNPITIGYLTFVDTDPATLGYWTLGDSGWPLVLSNVMQPETIVTANLAVGGRTNYVTGWGVATILNSLITTNTFVKAGPSHVVLNPPPATGNSLGGGIIISNGMLQLGPTSRDDTRNAVNQYGIAGGPIIFRGGELRSQYAAVPGSNPTTTPSVSGITNDIVVEAGQTGTLYLSPRAYPSYGGTVTGGGTLNLVVDYVRDNLGGNWSGFTGTVVVAASARGNSDLRFTDAFGDNGGWANARVHITTNGINANIVNIYNRGTAGRTYEIGELSATVPGIASVFAAGGSGDGASPAMTLVVGGLNTDATFSGNFSAPGVTPGIGIIKVGSGTWVLNGPTIEYSGITVVSNGVLQFGSGTTGKPGRSPVITNYAAVAFGRSDNALVVTNVIDGPGVVIQRGSGMTTLAPLTPTGANTYTGKTIITNGTIAVSNQLALGATPSVFVADQLYLSGGGLRALSDLALDDVNRGITLGPGGGTLSAAAGATLTVVNNISGGGDLRIATPGTVALAGAKSYTGKTILESGTLLLSDEASLGPAPGTLVTDQLTFNGGTLRPTTTLAIDDPTRGITFSTGGGSILTDPGVTLTLAVSVTGPGTLTKLGTGTLTINRADTRTGNTVINAGTLAIGPNGTIAASPLISVAKDAMLDVSGTSFILGSGQTLAGDGTVVGNFTAGNGSTISAGSSIGALAFANDLTLAGGATNVVDIVVATNDSVRVTGNLVLSGLNTIKLNVLESLPVGTWRLITYGGTLSGGTGNLTLAGYPMSRLTPSLAHDPIGKSINLVISGTPASLVWVGGLNGNAWDVATTRNWLNVGISDYFFNGDTVTFDATGATNPVVNLVGSLSPAEAIVDATADYTFQGTGKLTGLAKLRKAGTGTLTILTINDYSGPTVISGGTLRVGIGTVSGSLGTGPITNHASLVFNLPDTREVPGMISGTGTLTVQAGTLILSADNTYSGSTVIGQDATLQVGKGGPSGSLGTGAVSLNGNLVFNRTGIVTNYGTISGIGNLIVRGPGTVVLAANNSWAGDTVVDTGTLQVGAGGVTGTLGTAGSVTLTNGGTLAFNRADTITNAVAVLGTNGTLAQVGTGTLVITNEANNYGPTLITAGRLQLGDGVNPVGQLGRGPITVMWPGLLVINRPEAPTLTNLVTGTGGLVLMGPTNQISTVADVNTYSGGTIVSNATVVLVPPATSPADVGYQRVNNGAFGTGTVTFYGDSLVELAGARIASISDAGAGNFAVPINVPAGQTVTFWLPGRFTMSSTVTGSGTINLGVNYVRGDITANWVGFSGQLNVVASPVAPSGYDFRIANAAGFPNARVHLGDNVSMYSRAASGSTIPFGELTGTELSTIRSSSGGGGSPGQPMTMLVGGLNTDAQFDGQILDAISIVKVGSGKWTLTAQHTYTGNTIVSNGVLALATNSAGMNGELQSSPTITVVAPGAIDARGRTDGTLPVGSSTSQTLSGNGTVYGDVLVDWGGTLAPGFEDAVGTFTITGNLQINGIVNMKVTRAQSRAACDSITCASVTAANGTLNVTQLGTNDLCTGDVFKLFSVPVSGAFSSVNLPQYNADYTIEYVWTNMLAIDGTVRVLSGAVPPPPPVNTVPTNITWRAVGNALELSWPEDRIGWRLETNAVSVVATNQWFTWPGSAATNRVFITIDKGKANVFFRLVYP